MAILLTKTNFWVSALNQLQQKKYMGELLRLDGKANHSEFVINIRALVGSSLWNEFCEKSLRDFADAGKPSMAVR